MPKFSLFTLLLVLSVASATARAAECKDPPNLQGSFGQGVTATGTIDKIRPESEPASWLIWLRKGKTSQGWCADYAELKAPPPANCRKGSRIEITGKWDVDQDYISYVEAASVSCK